MLYMVLSSLFHQKPQHNEIQSLSFRLSCQQYFLIKMTLHMGIFSSESDILCNSECFQKIANKFLYKISTLHQSEFLSKTLFFHISTKIFHIQNTDMDLCSAYANARGYKHVLPRIRQGTCMYSLVYVRVHVCTQTYTSGYTEVLSHLQLGT